MWNPNIAKQFNQITSGRFINLNPKRSLNTLNFKPPKGFAFNKQDLGINPSILNNNRFNNMAMTNNMRDLNFPNPGRQIVPNTNQPPIGISTTTPQYQQIGGM
jgi:hypothetical protein